MIRATRIGDGPVIHPGLCDSLGDNINGPSLIEAPGWLGAPARFLLWFAHHEGRHIRLALADRPEGPWRVHRPGAIRLEETPLTLTRPDVPQPQWAADLGVDGLYPHVASPDVRIDAEAQRLVMVLHGLHASGEQVSIRAKSANGFDWEVGQEIVADQTYLRLFEHRGRTYALARGGEIMREGPDGRFEHGPEAFDPAHRHAGLWQDGDRLHVFWTRIGDAPERILHSTIDLKPDWQDWQAEGETEILRPDLPWEGTDQPCIPTKVGSARGRENGLRDPFLFRADGRLLMLYAGAGECALGLAEITGL